MQPYEALGLPDPYESIGMAGLTISVVIAVIGLTWLLVYQGGLASFGLVILAAFVGWVSFMYCESWEGSFGFGTPWGK